MSQKKSEGNEYPVGKRITALRTAKGLTTNRLANLAGISQSYLRDVELNGKNPTIEFLYLICQPLGISLKEFFADEKTTFVNQVNSEELVQKINRLNPDQKETLLNFLESME